MFTVLFGVWRAAGTLATETESKARFPVRQYDNWDTVPAVHGSLTHGTGSTW